MSYSALSLSSLIFSASLCSLLLNPSHVFFNSVIVFFSFVTSAWGFLTYSIFLLKFSLCSFFSQVQWASLWPLPWTLIYLHFINFFLRFYFIVCLKHIPLFLHYVWLSVLVSMHLMNNQLSQSWKSDLMKEMILIIQPRPTSWLSLKLLRLF